jgi:hypothetical protein
MSANGRVEHSAGRPAPLYTALAAHDVIARRAVDLPEQHRQQILVRTAVFELSSGFAISSRRSSGSFGSRITASMCSSGLSLSPTACSAISRVCRVNEPGFRPAPGLRPPQGMMISLDYFQRVRNLIRA